MLFLCEGVSCKMPMSWCWDSECNLRFCLWVFSVFHRYLRRLSSFHRFRVKQQQRCFIQYKPVVPKLWYAYREDFQGGTRDPSVLLHKKNTFGLHLCGSVNKFLHFYVLPLLVSKKWPYYNFSQPCCSCRICVKSGLPSFWSSDIG